MRAKVAERIYGIYKVHGNYSRVLKEWALIEKNTMKTSLQAASIEMETFAKSIDTLIDEEDQLAEQIKEYMYFADSLKVNCYLLYSLYILYIYITCFYQRFSTFLVVTKCIIVLDNYTVPFRQDKHHTK